MPGETTVEARNYFFKIERFTPQTMPFERLVEYYAELSKLVRAEALHLVDIKQSSHSSVLRVADGHHDDVARDFTAIVAGTAPKTQRRAAQAINYMLYEDETSATLSTTGGAEIIAFPGMSAPAVVRTKAQAEFMGELYQISGGSNKAHARVRIETAAYGVVFCRAPLTTAKALREFLFEDIKVSGCGVWTRSESDGWSISEFEIDNFHSVRRETLREAVREVRDLGIEWPLDAADNMRSLCEDRAR